MRAGVLSRLYPRYAFAIVVTLPTLRSTMRDSCHELVKIVWDPCAKAKSSLTPVCVVAFSIVALEFLVVMLPVGLWELALERLLIGAVAAETCGEPPHFLNGCRSKIAFLILLGQGWRTTGSLATWAQRT